MRNMKINVPVEVMTEVAELIEKGEIQNEILGLEDDEISINFDYTEKQRGVIMEILECVEDYNEDSDDDEDDDDDNDDDKDDDQ